MIRLEDHSEELHLEHSKQAMVALALDSLIRGFAGQLMHLDQCCSAVL